jgi:hypothetical protein
MLLAALRGLNGLLDVAPLHLEALRVSNNLFLYSMFFLQMCRWVEL